MAIKIIGLQSDIDRITSGKQPFAYFSNLDKSLAQLEEQQEERLKKLKVTVTQVIRLNKTDYFNFVADLFVTREYIREDLCTGTDEQGRQRCLLITNDGRTGLLCTYQSDEDMPYYAVY